MEKQLFYSFLFYFIHNLNDKFGPLVTICFWYNLVEVIEHYEQDIDPLEGAKSKYNKRVRDAKV